MAYKSFEDQMIRVAVSIASNIAEGAERNSKNIIHFLASQKVLPSNFVLNFILPVKSESLGWMC